MFRLVKILNGRTNQAEPMLFATTAGESYALGEALCLSDGALTKCGESQAPTYIAICDMVTDTPQALPVYPVSQGMVFECPVSGDTTALCVGDSVTLTPDALGITATAGGKATILSQVDQDGYVLVTF